MLSLKDQIIDELDKLTPDQQEKLLNFTKRLQATSPTPTSGDLLLAHIDTFSFDPNDLDEIAKAIEEGCEKVDLDGWD
jgi:hypothetical protein